MTKNVINVKKKGGLVVNLDEIKKIAINYLEEKRIEGDYLEYKKSHHMKDKILKTLCSFSNNLMNRNMCMLFIGVEEHSEPELKGTPIRPILGYDECELETVEKSIKSLLSYIKPKINFDMTNAKIDNRYFVIVAFTLNNNGPYEVLEKAEKDKTIRLKRGRYVRVERESRLATVKEEYELLRKFSNYHFTEELSKNATLDDLEVDYIREYLNQTSNRNNTSILSKQKMAQNMELIDPTTNMVKNFAILMFARNPEKFIPYSYVELIYKSSYGESIMTSKEYRGPIWKQVKNVMDDIKNKYLKSVTLRIEDKLESETIYNYPYSTVEELVTNAIVHKNYENPRTIQIYVYENSIVITNYNRPIPPITINDLNTKESFPNRMYENPSIREMFKSLDLIESFGSGIGKAKRAMIENGSEMFHFDEYDENIDITSVTIPINEKFVKYASKLKYLNIERTNLDIESQNLDIKINSKDIIGIINESKFTPTIKKTLIKIYTKYFNSIFGRGDIVEYLNCSNGSGTNYINYLIELKIIISVSGKGKGKYKFV